MSFESRRILILIRICGEVLTYVDILDIQFIRFDTDYRRDECDSRRRHSAWCGHASILLHTHLPVVETKAVMTQLFTSYRLYVLQYVYCTFRHTRIVRAPTCSVWYTTRK
jgi:hypothetical protein